MSDSTRYARRLLGLFGLWWIAMAISPSYRADWVLENVLSVAAVTGLVLTHRRFPLSRVSYTLLFVFGCLHTLGAHYTYAEVPYDDWWMSLTGTSFNALLGWERNHYDRFVHFTYGLLIAYPVR
jgi:putative membrane protein